MTTNPFLDTLRKMQQAEFREKLLAITEVEWREMPQEHLSAWRSEAQRRGFLESWRQATNVVNGLARAMGIIPSKEDQEDRLMLTRLAHNPDHRMTPDLVEPLMGLSHEQRMAYVTASPSLPASPSTETASLPEASTVSGETSTDGENAVDAALAKAIGPSSTGTSLGAPTTAESGFDVVAYRRLPLLAKRDAFIDNGFLYVRTAVLRDWMHRLTQGKCCRPQRENLGHHASDCWLRDAVR